MSLDIKYNKKRRKTSTVDHTQMLTRLITPKITFPTTCKTDPGHCEL